MAAPTVYSELSLAGYMETTLGPVAEVLGWTVGSGKLAEVVNDALVAYGVDDVAEAAEIGKLRAIARREAWRAASDALGAFYDFDSDSERFVRSQMHKASLDSLANAERDCMALGVGAGYGVTITSIERTVDPYAYVPPDEEVG